MPLMPKDGEGTCKSRDKSPYKYSCDDKTEQIMRKLVRKRGIVKGRLTRFASHLNSLTSLTTELRVDLKLRIKGAEILFSEFNEIQSKVEEIVPDCDIDEQLDQRQQFEDSYYSILARAESILSKDEEVPKSSTCHHHSNKPVSVKLPTISLPTFDGAYEHWLEYRDTYLSLVHNSTDISNIQKMHYLKSSLKGSAQQVINSIEISSDNYPVAWELLLNRYNNTRLIVHSHVKALFSIQPLSKESPSLIRSLIDIIINNLRALKTLGEPTDSWDTLIIYIVACKLDKTTERKWEENKGSLLSDSMSSLKVNDLVKFLKDRADLLETLSLSHSKENNNNNTHNKKYSSVNTSQCNVSSNKPPPPPSSYDRKQTNRFLCVVCKRKHPIYTCYTFINMNLQSKLKIVSDHNLCENCLRSGHTVENCLFGPCKQCNLKHNSLIHNNNRTTMTAAVTEATVPPSAAGTACDHNNQFIQVSNFHTDSYSNTQGLNMKPVLLSTALVEIPDKDNNYHVACALLDSGSQSCFVTRSLCQSLDLPLIQSTHEIRGVGNVVSHSTQTCEIVIKSRINTYSTRIKCFVLSEITATLPAVQVQSARLHIPNNMQLANTQFLESQKIDILIGADLFWDLLIDGKMRLPSGPHLQNTKLGWIISGSINHITQSDRRVQCNFTQSMDNQLRSFWELEELPKPRDMRTKEERACEESFITTTTRDSDGRFCVRIPLKKSPDVLGDSFL